MPGKHNRNQKSITDLINMKRDIKTVTQGVRMYSSAECAGNHCLVLGKFVFTYRCINNNTLRKIEKLEEITSVRFKTDLLHPYSR